jgi:hypothetical protein
MNMHRLGYHKTMVVRLAAASLLVIMLLLMLGSVQEDALTYDEPAHIVLATPTSAGKTPG